MNAFIRRASQLSCSAHRPHYHGDEAVGVQGPISDLVSYNMSEPHFVFLLRTPGFWLGEFALTALFPVTPVPHMSVQLPHSDPRVTGLLWTRPLCTLPCLLFAIYICWSEPHLSEARDCSQSRIPIAAGKVLGGVSVYPVHT